MAQNGRRTISAFLYKLNPFKSSKNSKNLTQSDPVTQCNQNEFSIAEVKLENDVNSEDNSSIVEVKLQKDLNSLDNSSIAEEKYEKYVKSEDNSSPQVIKQKKCPWLISFLCTNSYFDDCPKHDIPKKDCRLNYFCIYCPHAGPLCIACMEEDHKDHKFVRVNRCAKTAAVKESKAQCIDSSMVYPYMLSGEPAYFLRSDRPCKPIRRCVVCERVLRGKKIKTWWNMESKKRKRLDKMANDRKDAIYCSLMCKLKGVLRSNGKSGLSAMVHDDDYGDAIWAKKIRMEKDTKRITWESDSDQSHNSGEKQSGISPNASENNEEEMENVIKEKNQETNKSQHIGIKYTENNVGPNSNDQNILNSSGVDRSVYSHVHRDNVYYREIVSDEDIVDFDEAMRSHNQTVSNGDGDENIYMRMSNPSQILFDDDKTMTSLNQTSSEEDDDGDGDCSEDDEDSSEDILFDDDKTMTSLKQTSSEEDDDDDSSEDDEDSSEDSDDDSSKDNDDDKKTISNLSENASDDETMSYSNQAVPVDHTDETINTEHESSRDSDINDDDTEEEDEVEDENDQGCENELTDNNLDNERKLCDYTNLSRDRLELLVSERDSLTSDKSLKEGDPMSSNQHSSDDTKETANTQNNHNTNSSIVSSATKTSKEQTIDTSLIKSARVQTINPKRSDQSQDEFHDNENSDIDKTFHIIEPKLSDQNQDKFQDNKTNGIYKTDHNVEPTHTDHNQDNENYSMSKIDQIVAKEDEVTIVKGFKDNDKVYNIVAQANEINKLIKDNGIEEYEKLHSSDMEVSIDSINFSSSDQKEIPAIDQAKTFSGHVHKRKRSIRQEEQEEHNQYHCEAHYLNHDLIYHAPQFENDDGRTENKNTNDPLSSDMEVQTDNLDYYPVENVDESMIDMEVQTDNMNMYPEANAHETRTMEVQTDNIDTYPEVNVHESRTTGKRRRWSNSSPKPLATVTIDIYGPGRTCHS